MLSVRGSHRSAKRRVVGPAHFAHSVTCKSFDYDIASDAHRRREAGRRVLALGGLIAQMIYGCSQRTHERLLGVSESTSSWQSAGECDCSADGVGRMQAEPAIG